jgi:N-acetylglucosamine malate deacetylase 2
MAGLSHEHHSQNVREVTGVGWMNDVDEVGWPSAGRGFEAEHGLAGRLMSIERRDPEPTTPLAASATAEPSAPAAAAEDPATTTGPSNGERVIPPLPIFRRLNRDARFRVSRRAAQELLEALTRMEAVEDENRAALRIMVVVAHPDDEAIGASALLRHYRNSRVLHVTDGGGRSDEYAMQRGFRSREEYAEARRAELLDAMRLVGLNADRLGCLDIPDGQAARQLVRLCRRLMEVLECEQPDVVITHPYEGGHTDHDATAFAVHLACGILRREGAPAPLVLELASYHMRDGKRVRGEFLPNWRTPMRAVHLTPEGQMLKAQMFDRYKSQRDCLREFNLDVERFRVAPRYLFSEPPHVGTLDYERYGVGLTGAEWRAEAEKALDMLRARHRVAPRAD